jgi:hypothetical protein
MAYSKKEIEEEFKGLFSNKILKISDNKESVTVGCKLHEVYIGEGLYIVDTNLTLKQLTMFSAYIEKMDMLNNIQKIKEELSERGVTITKTLHSGFGHIKQQN